MLRIKFQYNFHPTGQGLFCSGVLQRKRQPDFVWVYDCGTSSSKQLLSDQVEVLRKVIGTRGCIDLLILSHFDNDHILGVSELLQKFRVQRLLLPYINLSERLIAAFQQADGSAVSFPSMRQFKNIENGYVEVSRFERNKWRGPALAGRKPFMPDRYLDTVCKGSLSVIRQKQFIVFA